MNGVRGEELLTSLGFSYSYVPKARFYFGNLLEVLTATPPNDAEEYLIGTTGPLGTYGLYEIYLTALMFVDQDRRVLSCFVTTRVTGL